MSSEILMTVRKKVTIETAKHQFTNALFWGDKAVSLSGGETFNIHNNKWDFLMVRASLNLSARIAVSSMHYH